MKLLNSITNTIIYIFFLIIIVLLSSINAKDAKVTDINFNVIAIWTENHKICVSVQQMIYDCTSNIIPLWECKVNIENLNVETLEYHYLYCDKTYEEDFIRSVNVTIGESNETNNDFLRKPQTEKVTFLPEIWETPYCASNKEIYNLDYVGTFYLESLNKQELELMNREPHNHHKVPIVGKYFGENFKVILNDWDISVAGNYSRMFTKQSFKMTYIGDEDEDNTIPKKIKLKAFPNDATMLREPICHELLKK